MFDSENKYWILQHSVLSNTIHKTTLLVILFLPCHPYLRHPGVKCSFFFFNFHNMNPEYELIVNEDPTINTYLSGGCPSVTSLKSGECGSTWSERANSSNCKHKKDLVKKCDLSPETEIG